MDDVQQGKMTGILRRVPARGRVLDLGCGPGFLERFVPEAVALDIDLENLRKAGGDMVLADAQHLPFKGCVFDTLFCIDSVHLFRDTAEVERVLTPGGKAVFTLFCNRYTRADRMRELKKRLSGLRVKEEFFVGDRELDAVVVVVKPESRRDRG